MNFQIFLQSLFSFRGNLKRIYFFIHKEILNQISWLYKSHLKFVQMSFIKIKLYSSIRNINLIVNLKKGGIELIG
jgi:hypothetical protein